MPNKKSHLSQAEHNKKFINALKLIDTDYTDCAVTSLFYSALHLVEAYFAGKYDKHHTLHMNRDSSVSICLPHCYDDYQLLKLVSEEARYKGMKFTAKDFSDRIIPSFENIEKNIYSHLK